MQASFQNSIHYKFTYKNQQNNYYINLNYNILLKSLKEILYIVII